MHLDIILLIMKNSFLKRKFKCNVFKWSRFEHIVSYKDHKGNEQKEMVGNGLKKCNKQGFAVCKGCDCEISHGYGSSGGGGGSRHICGAKHQAKLKVFIEIKIICISNQVRAFSLNLVYLLESQLKKYVK